MRGNRAIKRITGSLVLLVLLVCAFVILRPDLWQYYTDGFKIRQPGREAVVRQVLWDEPELMASQVNSKPDNYEPSMSSDGRTLVFSRGRAMQNADLFVTHWNGDSWEEPTPILELNSQEDELGPELSRDGSALYFYSNRKGGLGGYDIWMSPREAERWGEPVNLGTNINSAYNDYDPALSPSGGRLYLSSNRPRGTISEKERAVWGATLRESRNLSDYDIFVSEALEVVADEGPDDGSTETRRQFSEVVRVAPLNSLADEGQVSITPRGDFLYFSSDRAGGVGGFDIYRSRIFDGALMMPEHIGTPVNSALDDMDPTLWMEGYGLVFSSNRERLEDGEYRFRLYHSLSREVMSRTDLSVFDWLIDFLRLNKWWILALLLALLALLALLRLLLNKNFRRSLSLIQRCIVGSLLLHLLIAFLLSLWLVSEAVYQAVSEPGMEIAISEGALSRERLALDIREQVTELPSSSSDFEAQSQVERLPLPDTETVVELERMEPEAAAIAPPEFVTDVETSEAAEPPRQDLEDLQELEFSPQLPSLVLNVGGFQLETPSNDAPEPEPVASPLSAALETEQVEPVPDIERVIQSPEASRLENLPLEFNSTQALEISVKESPDPDSVPIRSAEQMPAMQPFESNLLAITIPMERRDVDAPHPTTSEAESLERDSTRVIPKMPSSSTEIARARRTNHAVAAEPLDTGQIVDPIPRDPTIPMVSESPSSIQRLRSLSQMEPSEPISLGELLRLEDRVAVLPETAAVDDSSDGDSALPVAKATPSMVEGKQAQKANQTVTPISQPLLPSSIVESSRITAAQPRSIEGPATVRSLDLTAPQDRFHPELPVSALRMEDRESVASHPSPSPSPKSEDALETDSVLGLAKTSVDGRTPNKAIKLELAIPRLMARVALPSRANPLEAPLAMPTLPEKMELAGSIALEPMMDTYKPSPGGALAQMEGREPPVPRAADRRDVAKSTDSSMAIIKANAGVTRQRPLLGSIATVNSMRLEPTRPAAVVALQAFNPLPMKAKPIELDEKVGLRMPKMNLATIPVMESPESLNRPYILRDPETRERLIETLGGSDETEAAIVKALDWLTRNQAQDGSWEVGRFGGRRGHRTAGTGLALLCYLGWGAKHNEPGPYQETVLRGLQFLLDSLGDDGRLWRHGDRGMYDQGIASIALAEAYGVSQDPILKEPVERALFFILRSSRRGSEWRYNPGDPGDTSVYGWQVMALKSGLMAGADLPEGVLEKAGRWLDNVGGGKHGGIYGYTSKGYHGPGMVAEGMFCQQLLGIPRTDPRMLESAAHLAERLPRRQSVDFYYFYYGCLALYQHQGPIWKAWNERMRGLLLSLQTQDGEQSGSWKARGARPQDYGRLVSTTMAVLSLEVYYRYLPLYGLERD